MLISIACINNLNVLGDSSHNGLLWYSKQDLSLFKAISIHYPNIVTKATFNSMPPIKNREFLKITHTPNFTKNEYNLETIQAIINRHNEDFLNIGGLTLYTKLLPLTDIFIICKVNNNINGDLRLCEATFKGFCYYHQLYADINYTVNAYSHFSVLPQKLLNTIKTWQLSQIQPQQ